jgi:hypothetical protein
MEVYMRTIAKVPYDKVSMLMLSCDAKERRTYFSYTTV